MRTKELKEKLVKILLWKLKNHSQEICFFLKHIWMPEDACLNLILFFLTLFVSTFPTFHPSHVIIHLGYVLDSGDLPVNQINPLAILADSSLMKTLRKWLGVC